MPVAGNDDLRTGVPGAFQNPVVRLVLEDRKPSSATSQSAVGSMRS
jgi:hypothetical protein